MKARPAVCVCKATDDHSPQIFCAHCRIWFHFACVELSEHDAADIHMYICPTCSRLSGRHSAMTWDGDQALEQVTADDSTIKSRQAAVRNAHKKSSHKRPSASASATPSAAKKQRKPSHTPKDEPRDDSDSDAPSSEDDYIDDRQPGQANNPHDQEDEEDEEDLKPRVTRTRARARPSRQSTSQAAAAAPFSSKRHHIRAVSSDPETSSDDADRPKRLNRGSRRAPLKPHPSASLSRSPSVSAPNPRDSSRKRKNSVLSGADVGAGKEGHMAKRKKSNAGAGVGPLDDPTRKYCLGKFGELFKDVFLRYPHVHVLDEANDDMDVDPSDSHHEIQVKGKLVPKPLDQLSEEEKNALLDEASRFSAALEQAVSMGKYKDRFRTLHFNLIKPDRTAIHARVTNHSITPSELSHMSSTDLADEETKAHIAIVEKEALEQTILQKSTLPRAKLTHKGLQDIDLTEVHGEAGVVRMEEERREREEEEQREKEKKERERYRELQMRERERALSMSSTVPPESPLSAMHSPGFLHQQQHQQDDHWGAPPPVPMHAMSPSASDFHGMAAGVGEPELSLTDLINIDDEGAPTNNFGSSTTPMTGMTGSSPSGLGLGLGPGMGGMGLRVDTLMDTAPFTRRSSALGSAGGGGGGGGGAVFTSSPVDGMFPSPGSAMSTSGGPGMHQQSPVTGISPFAAKQPERPRPPSFDLNSIWSNAALPSAGDASVSGDDSNSNSQNQGKDQDTGLAGEAQQGGGSPLGLATSSSAEARVGGEDEGDAMELESVEADDRDFDMFLEDDGAGSGKDKDMETGGKDKEASVEGDKASIRPKTPEPLTVEGLPVVWKGKVALPLDTSLVTEPPLLARQIGGKPIPANSPLWGVLFPNETLRIEGRVVVEHSVDYLLQTRLNPTKELYAVAFVPDESGDEKVAVASKEEEVNKAEDVKEEKVEVVSETETKPETEVKEVVQAAEGASEEKPKSDDVPEENKEELAGADAKQDDAAVEGVPSTVTDQTQPQALSDPDPTKVKPADPPSVVPKAPTRPTAVDSFNTFCNFFINKHRHGLVFPWGSRPKENLTPGRELYMIPLRTTDPLPEFMELLDNFKLPKEGRERDYIIGVWIINKGKLNLAPLPIPPPMAMTSSGSNSTPGIGMGPPGGLPPTTASLLSSLSSSLSSLPPPPPPLPPPGAGYPPHIPGVGPPPLPPPIPPISGLPGLPPTAGIPSAALAAEVATLTPDQIQNVIRTLASTTNLLPPVPPGSVPPANVPMMHPSGPPPPPPPGVANLAASFPWLSSLNLQPQGGTPGGAGPGSVPPPPPGQQSPYGYPPPPPPPHHPHHLGHPPHGGYPGPGATPPQGGPGAYPGATPPYHHPPPHGHLPPPAPPGRDYEYDDYYDREPMSGGGGRHDRHYDRHGDRDRHDRSWRGGGGGDRRSGGRGRGGGGGGGGGGRRNNDRDEFSQRKSVDSGWPRRQPQRGSDSGQGHGW